MTQWDDFDCTLATALSELPPPEDTVRDVTPWRTAMGRVVTGLCLTCFTLNFLYLQYLLPAIGAVQLYLGLRSLRKANRWFQFSWYCSICKVIILFTNSVLIATRYGDLLASPRIILQTGSTLALLLMCRQGLRRAAREVDHPGRRDPFLWAAVWYGVILVLALLRPQPGWPATIAVVYAFCRIVRSLRRITEELENWGYAVQAAPVRLDSGRFQLIAYGTLLALVLTASALSCHVPLNGTDIEQNFDSSETAAVQSKLAELGFPEELSGKLLPEDLLSLKDTVQFGNNYSELHLNNSFGFQGEAYAFQLPDGNVRYVHFFTPKDQGGFWRCGVTMKTNAALKDAACRLFYEKNGQSLIAALSPNGTAENHGIGYFGDAYQTYTTSFPAFSWPWDASQRQGYVIFTAEQAANPKTVLDEILTYGEDGFLRYPYPAEDIWRNTWRSATHGYYGMGYGLVYKADEEWRFANDGPPSFEKPRS